MAALPQGADALSFAALFPYAGVLLLLLPLLWLQRGRSLPVVHKILRTAIFACLILALMQPSVLSETHSRLQITVLDQRDSLSPHAREQARAMLARLRAGMPSGSDLVVLQLGGTPVPASGGRVIMAADPGSLSKTLDQALALVPQGRSAALTLITNGLSRDSHWGQAIQGLVSRGIAVNTIGLPQAERAPFIAGLTIPPVRAGAQARATIDVDGNGRGLSLALYSGKTLLARSPVFDADGTARITVPFTAGPAGFTPLRAVLESGTGTDSVQTTLAVQDPLSILYLGQRQQGGAAALQALLGKGFAVEAHTPGSLPASFGFEAYRAVMIDDLPAARLPAPVQRDLLSQVAQGRTGLFYSGGEDAFGPGGYAHSPLAEALPVTLKQEDKLEKPSVALAIVIDTSGSMQGQALDLAKQVARFTVQTLTRQDSVGVVEFYGARQWSVPMQPARDIPEVERAIGRMQANGGSVLYPAIQEAYFGLKNADARYKHILVISDAGVEEARYEQLLRHIAQDRVNVSTVLVGQNPEGEERMAEWARWGQGRYYAVTDETSIVQPRFNDPQVKPSPGYKHGRFALTAPDGNGWWGGMSLSAMPPLSGYAAAGKRAEAQTLLTAPNGDPVLATRPYGAGRVTALMTEPAGQGTASWRGWKGYGQWLGRVLARTADQQSGLALSLQRRFGRLAITLRTAPETATAQTPQVSILDESGAAEPLPGGLEERAPGLFTADIAFPADRTAEVEARLGNLVARAADRPRSDVSAAARMPVSGALPLASLSRATGGVHAENAESLMAQADKADVKGQGTLTAFNLWSPLLLLALALYLIELAYRRWPTRRGAA
ncbi:VWA domain-containing protein [Novosphingobium beihaiensis]|uniref:VWA domain-containing protein n=1 Tax=Novosphingobium beihaiensis TaxID=2930389 RepID=A0ABT0BL57_9SPHN|nr:VWA domain-containing protein [Novosphingobium beihaiensis]MCJ2185796.1 VWA domain-containing protein [Novosphingobium beihaiensis]